MTDLGTAIEQHVADRPKNPKPEPITVDITGPHTTLVRTLYAWRAWMEDSDMWDGSESYDQLDTALLHAALDYVSGEYPTPEPDDDPEEFAKPGPLVWVYEHGTWHLNDNGYDTMVRVYLEAVYGLPEADAEVSR